VYDPAFLVHAWERVSANTGARTPGIDKATVAGIETWVGVEEFLGQIRDLLKSGGFGPVEVRRVLIPKASGKLRKLGIPTVADRVVQASLKAVLEPIFEAGFQPCSYGFRPRRRAQDAIAEIQHFGTRGYAWVLEADIKACFDEMSHTALMDRLRARIKDKRVRALVKAFLKSGVLTELGDREETLTGTPQGGILSPLLANIALSALDDHFSQQWSREMGTDGQRAKRRRHGQGTWRLVRYADDFVLMVSGDRHHAETLREEVAAVLAPVGLRLAPEKTRVVHIDEGFRLPRPQHPPPAEERDAEVLRLHQAVQEGHPGHQGQGVGKDVQVNPPHGPRRADYSPEQVPGGVGELFPARSVQGSVRRGRPPRVGSADALDTRQIRGQAPARDDRTPPSLLRPGVAVRLQRSRAHRRIQRQSDPLPLPRQQDTDPVDPEPGSRDQQLTSGQGTWSARCGESRTPGAGGGSRETTGGDTGTAPAGLPHRSV
jgi:group II intron reverse transcriptase/maturase